MAHPILLLSKERSDLACVQSQYRSLGPGHVPGLEGDPAFQAQWAVQGADIIGEVRGLDEQISALKKQLLELEVMREARTSEMRAMKDASRMAYLKSIQPQIQERAQRIGALDQKIGELARSLPPPEELTIPYLFTLFGEEYGLPEGIPIWEVGRRTYLVRSRLTPESAIFIYDKCGSTKWRLSLALPDEILNLLPEELIRQGCSLVCTCCPWPTDPPDGTPNDQRAQIKFGPFANECKKLGIDTVYLRKGGINIDGVEFLDFGCRKERMNKRYGAELMKRALRWCDVG